MTRYVCAFRGRRDSYQVPLALAEAGLLDQFITDAYSPPSLRRLAALLPARWRAKAEFRSMEGIPGSAVRCLWPTTFREHWRHRRGLPRDSTYLLLDRNFSEAAATRARRTRSDLLLYSSYAWEAFRATYPHHPRKVLFQYHPHPEVEDRILAGDRERFASIFGSPSPDKTTATLIAPGDRDAWRLADLVICASTFTRGSLLSEGLAPGKCAVIPYGIDLPGSDQAGSPPDRGFRALFVGSGVQRKGLHHLLLAWKAAELPDDSRLTLVCRNIEAPLAKLAETVTGVELVRGTSAEGLNELYATNHLFVMPSLVEGFGQVYLEALAQGCPVLGTPNTCLPDLGGEASGVFITAVGNIEGLAEKLRKLAATLPGNQELRSAARALAGRWTWPRFRRELVAALTDETST